MKFRLVTATFLLFALLWRLPPVRAAQTRLLKANAASMLLAPSGRWLGWNSPNGCAWADVSTLHVLSRFSVGDKSPAQVLNLSSDGNLALVRRGKEGTIGALELWKRKGQTAVRKWDWKGTADVSAALILRDHILLHASPSIWTLDLKGVMRKYQNLSADDDSFYNSMDAFSSDGRFLVDGNCLLDLKTGKVTLEFASFTNGIRFSPSSQFVAASDISMLNEEEIYVYSCRTGRQVPSPHVNGIIWAPDDTLCNGSQGKSLRFYNVETGKVSHFRAPVFPTESHIGLWDTQFSSDGKITVAVRSDHQIWVVTS